MGIILLAVIPLVLMVCFCLVIKWTGFNILPKGLRTNNGKIQFKLPHLTRASGHWAPVPPPEDDDEEDPDFNNKLWDYM